jgi:hypothetical protein
MRALLLAAILTACAPRGKWTRIDTAATVAFAALLVADYRQTTKPGGIFDRGLEANPILGDGHGQGGMPVGLYLSVQWVGFVLATSRLPTSWRRFVQGGALTNEAHTVWLNWSQGFAPL